MVIGVMEEVVGVAHQFRTRQDLSVEQVEIAAHSCGKRSISSVDHLRRLIVVQLLIYLMPQRLHI